MGGEEEYKGSVVTGVLSSLSVVASLLLFCSCSMDYESLGEEGDGSEDVTNIILSEVHYVSVEKGKKRNKGHLAKAEISSSTGHIRMTEMRHFQFSPSGKLLLEGHADAGFYNSQTGDAFLEGHVTLVSPKNGGVRLTSDSLTWQSSEHVLVSEKGENVTIVRDSGESLRAKGCIVDLKRGTATFYKVQGEM